LTLDNGSEHVLHERITRAIGIRCYFCEPYRAWERATNEQRNGLIRWYFPKGTDFARLRKADVLQVESAINNRPMKCLGFKTPLEIAAQFGALRT
jgi:IS30 family transposase